MALTVWWMTAAPTVPYSAGPRGGQPPLGEVGAPGRALTTFGFGASACATGVEATEMKAELIASRAEFSSRSADSARGAADVDEVELAARA